jgi:hypothetical protein
VELLEQILSNQNMNEAYLRVYKNKGASGYFIFLILTSSFNNIHCLF